MDTTPMDTSFAQANALHRLLLQSLLSTRFGPTKTREPEPGLPPPEAADTMPMLYRSEAFAEDLVEVKSLAR